MNLECFLVSFVKWPDIFEKSLTKLTKKHSRFNWTPVCEEAFQEQKLKPTTAPVLTIIDGNEDLKVWADASREGIGAVLMQRGQVVAYASRQLKPHEENLRNS